MLKGIVFGIRVVGLENGRMNVYKKIETDNYVFRFKENSLAEKEIRIISECQEACFHRICSSLNIKFGEKINYWLCDTPEEVGEIYGDNEPCNGFASEPNEVYAVYNSNIKCIGAHEDAHLISYKINIPCSGFLREGFAMYFDRCWWGIDNLAWSKYYFEHQKRYSIIKLLQDDFFYSIDCSITYPIAGAFTEYLIRKFGKEKYIDFYKCSNDDFLEHAKNILGKSMEEIEAKFWEYIESCSVDEDIEKRIEELLR